MNSTKLLLLVISLLSTSLYAVETPVPIWVKNKVYINPDFTGIEKGTFSEPFKSTAAIGFTWTSKTAYFFKRNTVMTDIAGETENINGDSIIIGAYGEGNRPVLVYNIEARVLRVSGNYCTINDIELVVPLDLKTHGISLSGNYATVNNCIIKGGNRGISGEGAENIKIMNCDISGCMYDGIYISPSDTVKIFNCYVHDQIVLPSLENQGSIDNIHIYSSKMVYIDSVRSDHSNFPGKFCLILTDTDSASIKNSAFIGHSENGSIYSAINKGCSYENCYFERGQYGIWGFGGQWIKNCVFRGQNDNAIFGGKYISVRNSNFINQNYAINKYSTGMIKEIKNCIFYDFIGTLQTVETLVDTANFKNNCVFSQNAKKNKNYYKGKNVIEDDPLFINASNQNFRLAANSPCIDKGIAMPDIKVDILGIQRPQGSKIDYGAYEYISGLPNVFDLTTNGIGCANDSSTLTLAGSEPFITYKLYRNDIFTGTSLSGTGSELNFGKQSKIGYYSVTAIKNDGVLSNKMNGTIGIMIHPMPQKQYLLGGGFYDTTTGLEPITLSSSEKSVFYQLYLNNNPIDEPMAGDGDSINFGLKKTNGKYTVIATNQQTNCWLKMPNYVLVANVLHIDELSQLSVKAIPNPSSGSFFIEFGVPNDKYTSISIFNIAGALVYKNKVDIGATRIPVFINGSNGEYSITLSGKNVMSKVIKVIVAK